MWRDGYEEMGIPVPPYGEPMSGLSFPSEAHLRDFIVHNLPRLHYGGLEIYVEKHTGRRGVEFQTSVGIIDILTINADRDCFVVWELKNQHTADQAVGQLARYMAWIREHLADGARVDGRIITPRPDPKLAYAASMLPNVDVMIFDLSLVLNTLSCTVEAEVAYL